MSITYRTSGAWGPGKGSNLAPAEVDGNFYDVDQRISAFEDNPPEPIKPVSITLEGYNFTMGFDDGTILGPITMTYPVPQWRGDWTPSTLYNDMDYIIAPDGGFGAVMQTHTSGTTFDWAATDPSNGLPLYKQIVGSNGMTVAMSDLTDVAISDATVGDMLIWGGSYWANATPSEVTLNLLPFLGDSGTGGARGLVPAPAAGDGAANKFLKANGTWAVPATGSGGGSSSLAGLSDVSIISPVNQSLLQYHSSDGKWHNATLPELGAGTVTQVATGAGLSGGPITSTGTVSLASVTSNVMLANTSLDLAPPIPTTLTTALDAMAGSARGSLLHRNAVGWQTLPPGTSGQYLKTGGGGSDVSWDNPAGSGSVTSVTAGSGLSGGTITASGTIALASIADARVLANVSGGTAPPTETTVPLLLDKGLGTTRGSVLVRDGSAWTALAPGAAGQVLTSGGSGANVAWSPAGGSSGISALTGDVAASGTGSVLASVQGLQGRAVANTAPTSNQVLQWTGTQWAPATVTGGAVATVGDTFPASPVQGQLHWLSTDGQLYIRYGTPGAWVIAVTPPSVLPPGTSTYDSMVYDGLAWGAERPRYGVAFSFVGGVLPANQLLGIHCFTKSVTFASNFAMYLGHMPEAGGTANATASTVITVERALAASPNTWTSVGTITFAAGTITPTFSTSGLDVSFTFADRMRLVGPSTPDPTFANFYCSLVGREA